MASKYDPVTEETEFYAVASRFQNARVVRVKLGHTVFHQEKA